MHDQPIEADSDDAGSLQDNSGDQQEPPLVTVPLSHDHLTEDFCCSRSENVQQFLRQNCAGLQTMGYTRVFVLPYAENSLRVMGYYSLSAGHIERALMSNKFRNTLPRFPAPMALLGHMGRDDHAEPGKWGRVLIQDAARRISRVMHLGIWGLMLNAETDGLVPWYAKAGFKTTPPEKADQHNPRLMYGPLKNFLPEIQ